MSSTYQRWLFELPAELEELFGAVLWEHGCEGLEDPDTTPFDERSANPSSQIRLMAYFSDPAPVMAESLDLEGWAGRGVRRIELKVLPVRDWLEEYRAQAMPLDVGSFRLDPREPEESDPGEGEPVEDAASPDSSAPYLLRLPARTAFGTGSHESTRLALLLLERLAEEGRFEGASLLDVGTGSGVLAFAALRLGIGRVVGYDIDLPSVCMAETNSGLNPWPAAHDPSFFVGGPAALSPSALFDLLVINVLPERIAADLPALVGHLAPGGRLLSSGNLVEQRDRLSERFATLGLFFESEHEEGDWLAMVWQLGTRDDSAATRQLAQDVPG